MKDQKDPIKIDQITNKTRGDVANQDYGNPINPFKLAWRTFQNMWHKNRNWAIVLLVVGVFSTFSQGHSSYDSGSASIGGATDVNIVAIVTLILSAGLLLFFLAIAVSTLVDGLFAYVALQSNRGKEVSFKQAFDRVKSRFWLMFTARLLATLRILGGFLLFIVPGIIAAVRYELLPTYMMDSDKIDDNTTASDILKNTRELSQNRWTELAGSTLISAVLPVIGVCANYGALAALYDIYSNSDNPVSEYKTHWLNKLAVILSVIAAIMAIVALVLVGVYLAS